MYVFKNILHVLPFTLNFLKFHFNFRLILGRLSRLLFGFQKPQKVTIVTRVAIVFIKLISLYVVSLTTSFINRKHLKGVKLSLKLVA